MSESFTHKYIPRISQREQNLFVEEYYSSTDTQIILDGIQQTEISYITYSLQEQLKPLYGYSSRTYDDIAIGNRIITGMFKVPIKNPTEQTPKEDIVKVYNSNEEESEDPNGDYNSEEDKLKNAVEWIDSNIKDTITETNNNQNNFSSNIDDNKEYNEYVNKLNMLGIKDKNGHTITTSSPKEDIKRAIQKLQSEYNIDNATGDLTENTKSLIDDLMADLISETSPLDDYIYLPIGAVIYMGPGKIYDSYTVTSPSKVRIIDSSIKDWIQIKFNNGNIGWILSTDNQ